MQKPPNNKYSIEYYPYDLNADFPISHVSKTKYEISDEPITRLHYHNFIEIGYCYEGSGIFMIDNKVLPFATGDASIIFGNEMHLAKSNSGNISRWHFMILNPLRLFTFTDSEYLTKIIGILNGSYDFINIINKRTYPDIIDLIEKFLMSFWNAGKAIKL
jgi:hypothetical protein